VALRSLVLPPLLRPYSLPLVLHLLWILPRQVLTVVQDLEGQVRRPEEDVVSVGPWNVGVGPDLGRGKVEMEGGLHDRRCTCSRDGRGVGELAQLHLAISPWGRCCKTCDAFACLRLRLFCA
jgi:hypothetical protein